MLVLLSPAKTLDYVNKVPASISSSSPLFFEETAELIKILQNYSAEAIAKLMDISPKLSELNYQRFQDFNNTNLLKQAIYAYKGDVYEGFELEKYTDQEINFANQHLRILSGLYGMLRPLDLIKPYRLEMGIALPNALGKNLYNFWNDRITKALNQQENQFIINLASVEYSSAVLKNQLLARVIDISFKEKRQGEYKIIGINAKKARGLMANYIVRNFITDHEDLKKFKVNNYEFVAEFSSPQEYVFVR